MKKCSVFLILALLLGLTLPLASANSTTPSFDVGTDMAGAVLDDGSLMMWGKNEFGEFGNGKAGEKPAAGFASAFTKTQSGMKAVTFGSTATSYFLAQDGTLYACGLNNGGTVGNGESKYAYQGGVTVPYAVLTDVVKVEAGDSFALALQSDGSLWGWGVGLYVLKLTVDWQKTYVPVRIAEGVADFSCAGQHAAILKEGGKLYAAGNGSNGELGVGRDYESRNAYGFQFVADNIKSVFAGTYNTYAIDNAGALWACGANNYGTLFTGICADAQWTLTKVTDGPVKAAAAWSSDALYITESGTLYAVGGNADGQLGHAGFNRDLGDARGVIFKVADNVTDAAIGNKNILYRTADGTLYMTGVSAEIWGKTNGEGRVKLTGVAADPGYTVTVPVPAGGTAYAATQTVRIDGKAVELQAYALKDENGNATNYVKIRDVAAALDGTRAQFNVGWDNAVNIVTGQAYTSRNGQENKTPYSGDRPYSRPEAKTLINGAAAGLRAFVLTDDAGNGSTYYQLRDLGRLLGFNVGWSADKGVFVETDKVYDPGD